MLDPLDCRILDSLDRDARLSCDQIARKLKVSGDTVLYRLSKLREQHVLQSFSAIVDFAAVGLLLFRISIKTRKNGALEKIGGKIFELPYFHLIVEAKGQFDLVLWGAATSLFEIQKAHALALENLGAIVRESSLEVITETIAYSRGYLINRPGKVFPARGGSSVKKLDKIDLKILQVLRLDARKSAAAISVDLKITSSVVSYRIKRLEELGIIVGYQLRLNSEMINLQRVRIQLDFRGNYKTCSEELRKFCEATPAVTRLEFQIGAWPAELGVELQSFSTLHDILDRLKALAQGMLQVVGLVFFQRTLSAPSSVWNGLFKGGGREGGNF